MTDQHAKAQAFKVPRYHVVWPDGRTYVDANTQLKAFPIHTAEAIARLISGKVADRDATV
jgi:hypothetical protein